MTNSTIPKNGRYSKEQIYGASIEAWILDQLTARGYPARPLSDWQARADILVTGGLLIEVKGARPTWRQVRPNYYRPRWQFNIGNRPNYDHVVILVAEDNAGMHYPYIVPSWLLWSRTNVSITSHPRQYRGMFAPYLDAWRVIDEVQARRRRYSYQLSLLEVV